MILMLNRMAIERLTLGLDVAAAAVLQSAAKRRFDDLPRDVNATSRPLSSRMQLAEP
jgi:hypothetical protein